MVCIGCSTPDRNELEDLKLLSFNGNGAFDEDEVNTAAAGNFGISAGSPITGDRPSIDVELAFDERRLLSPQLEKYDGCEGPNFGVGIMGIDVDS